ncbi:hypothetical protein PR003_g211 [Phytophthora rubi]|uniref:U4/U6.U5 tri-snRNP-associated protein 1 n=1 Tax=Phytophthora rubi TaxID=129364 RepID=A0A6A4G953_9STRA|nr:hypothetical protein PR002_g19489 [Phytophthora rubi]KAE8999581.1 hypothetical protein PR001_g19014 [Phytophthora rubi]KAE9360389.1 hypothetical protein PR003_g211 [Phytophthora rubi]
MGRSRYRSPARSRRHGGPSSSSSSRRDHDRHASSSRRRSRSRSRRREDAPPADDKSGEISLSVEETNRLRLSLGLKPLAVGPSKKEQAVVSVQKSSAQLEAEREQQEIKRKLQQSRTRRELTQKLAGKSLGEQLKLDLEAQKKGQKKGSHDALEWVKQSRSKKEEKKKEKKKEEKDEYDAAALAGMTVGHALDTFEDGQEVVLTLKDARVLGEDGNDLNEAEDELVNVELSEKDRRLDHQARAKRAAMPVYSGYDDDEFIEMGSSRKRKSGSKLLAQYDEEQDASEAAAARKFRLDTSGGSAAVESEGKQEEEDDVAVISLSMDRTKQVEDYYTKEEVEAQFAKHKKNKKLRKKNKKSRRQHDEDLGENDAVEVQLNTRAAEEDGEDAESLVAQLEQEALQAGATGSKDRGKRKRSRRDDDEDPEEEENLLRFQEAREKANAVASEALAASSGKRRMKRRPVDDSEIVDDAAAIEMELGASLARARQLAQQQTQTQAPLAPTTSEARIAQLVSQTISNEDDTTQTVATDSAGDVVMDSSASTNNKPVGHVFGEVGTASNTVVFNEATDFETRLRDAMEKRAAQFQVAAGGTAAPTTAEKPQQAPVAEETKYDDSMEIDEEMKEEDNDEDEETKENEVWGEEQPLVGTGMGATLALLRKTGDLRQTRVERQAGRANDARDRSFEDDLRIKNGVKLDYRDEFGRLLTKKEAFRMLSYKFHGHEPGKKKKEKRLKQLKEELEAQKLLSGEGSTKMMKVLEKKQKHTKEAHVVLSSGV